MISSDLSGNGRDSSFSTSDLNVICNDSCDFKSNQFVCVSFCSLGQLASMAGLDRTDLQPLRGQRPLHLVGSHQGDGDLLTRVGHRDVGTRTDHESSVRDVKMIAQFHFPETEDI